MESKKMKKMKKQLLSSILLFIITMLTTGYGCTPCEYKDYAGVITIEDIRRQAHLTSAPESDDEKLVVSHTFKAEREAPRDGSNLPKQILLTRKEIDQKKVVIGGQFRAKAKYIVRGTCSPGPYLDEFEKWQ